MTVVGNIKALILSCAIFAWCINTAEAATNDSPNSSAELLCLAMTVYGEARGGPLLGQQAVAAVVMNRVHSGRYPHDVCAVVTQPGQFSFTWQPPREDAAWRQAVTVAVAALSGRAFDPTGGALHYHEVTTRTYWTAGMTGRRIGDHFFWTVK